MIYLTSIPSHSSPVSKLPDVWTVLGFEPVDSASTSDGPEDHEKGYDCAKQPHDVALSVG